MAKSHLLYDHYRPHKRVVEDGTIFDRATGVFVKPPSMTKQSHKEECDINNIIKTFKVSGMVTHVNTKAQTGAYIDLPDNMDFQQAVEIVRAGEQAFASLPSKVRSEFDNSPEAFLGFMASSDPGDRQRAIDLGLIQAPPP